MTSKHHVTRHFENIVIGTIALTIFVLLIYLTAYIKQHQPGIGILAFAILAAWIIGTIIRGIMEVGNGGD